MNDETEVVVDTTKILEIFEAGMEKGVSEDDIKMKMISAKSVANFKNVTRFFNQFMIDTGRAISREDKAAHVVTACGDGSSLATEEGFGKAVANLAKAAKGVSETAAASLIRAWGKKNEVETFAKPAGAGGTRNPFVTNFHAALIANPKMTEDGLKKVISDLPDEKDRVNPTRWFNQHNAVRKVVNQVAAA